MNIKTVMSIGTVAALLTACGGGDVNLTPTNNTTDSNNVVNNGGGGTTSPCASYLKSGTLVVGTLEGDNCRYCNTFVSDTNPVTTELLIPLLPNGGVHIFDDS